MNPTPHDPLSAEERALAERLKRLGPHDGPSASLDARILAAARAAAGPVAAPPRRRGWGMRLAMPGAFVTALGTAAAFALVIGVAWQLRPIETPRPARGERPSGDDGFVAAEIIRKVPPAPVPPPPAEPAPTVARAPAAARRARPSAAQPAERSRALSAPIAKRAAAAPVPTIHQQLVTEAARVSVDARPAPAAPAATADAATAQAAAPTTTPSAARPVRDDIGLPPELWLQRIRERRDAGDLDGARASLRHFRREHPHLHLPRDLQPLGR